MWQYQPQSQQPLQPIVRDIPIECKTIVEHARSKVRAQAPPTHYDFNPSYTIGRTSPALPSGVYAEIFDNNRMDLTRNRKPEPSPSSVKLGGTGSLSTPDMEFSASCSSDDSSREDTPPLFNNMHWVPDDIIQDFFGFESNTPPRGSQFLSSLSLSNESFNDTPDLVDPKTPSLSARRCSQSLSTSPNLSSTPWERIRSGSTCSPAPTTMTTHGSDLSRRQPRTLADFVNLGTVAQSARDESVSRLLQKEIRYATRDDRQRALDQILPEIVSLARDSHGNYALQKFIEHGHPEHRSQICSAILSSVWDLTQHTFGCRVVQKVIEYGDVPSKLQVFEHLLPHLDECIADDNGNYVVQKLIGELPPHLLEPIYEVFRGRSYYFCTHQYGCRIVQRLLGHASPEFTKTLCDEILMRANELAKHQWGNYVIQYVLESGKPPEVMRLTKILLADMAELACDQLASNVIETCIKRASPSMINQLFREFLSRNNDELLSFMNHKYGNFVAGTLIQKCDCKVVRKKLFRRLKRFNMISEIRASQYGRHVWAKLEEKVQGVF